MRSIHVEFSGWFWQIEERRQGFLLPHPPTARREWSRVPALQRSRETLSVERIQFPLVGGMSGIYLRRSPVTSARARQSCVNPTVERDQGARRVSFRRPDMNSLLRDLRGAARALRRAILFVTLAVGSLGIAVGVNTILATLLDAVASPKRPRFRPSL